MLRWRLTLGTLLIAAIVGLCWLDGHAAIPGVWLYPLTLLLTLAASQEMIWMASSRGLKPVAWVVYLGNALIVTANWSHWIAYSLDMNGVESVWFRLAAGLGPFAWPMIALGLSVIAAFVGEMRRYTGPGQVCERLGYTVLSLLYVGGLMSFVVQMRFIGSDVARQNWGLAPLASLIAIVKMCDTGAYTVGRLIGRHKMAPVLSPGKTWEGAVGGLAFACLASWIVFYQVLPRLYPLEPVTLLAKGWVAYGLAVGVAGMIGDLAESLLKRDLGRKDSSPWMPGFGGVLDVLDSIILAAPVAFLFWFVWACEGL